MMETSVAPARPIAKPGSAPIAPSPSYAAPNWTQRLPLKEITVADHLKAAGPQMLAVKPVHQPGGAVMDLREMTP